jgi:hypothetical protein
MKGVLFEISVGLITVYQHHFSHQSVFALLPQPHLILSQSDYIQILYPTYRHHKWVFLGLQAGVESIA